MSTTMANGASTASDDSSGGGGGIAIGLGAFLDLGKSIETHIKGNREPKPLRYKVHGSVTTDGNSPFLIPVLSHPQGPAAGRVWNVLSIGLYGADGHSTLSPAATSTVQAGGTATTPAAGATIVSIVLPAGTWAINWSALPSGTLAAAADNNNLRLQNVTAGTTILSPIIFDAAPSPTQTENSTPVIVTLTQQSTIAIQAIGLATTGAVYTADLFATPVSAAGSASGSALSDLFVGKPPYASGAATDPIIAQLSDLVPQPDNSIPVTSVFSRRVIWAKHGEIPYALAYGVATGTTLTIVATVDDYAICDVEALSV